MADIIMVVNSGISLISGRMKGTSTEPNFLAWGTGTTPPTATDTTLELARPEVRVLGASSITSNSQTNDTYQCVGILTCTGTPASIAEFGQFNSSVGGDMLIHGTFSPINLNVGDSIQFSSQLVFSR